MHSLFENRKNFPIYFHCKIAIMQFHRRQMTPRALVIEDDHAIRLLLEAVLAHESIECDQASDGEVALRKIARCEYDAILLDLLLPETDGFAIVGHLKRNHPHLLPRVIVITAAADTEWRAWPDRGLVHCILRKPLDIHELMGHVRSCMGCPVPRRQA